MEFQKKGIIDLGSNSIRFVIFKITKTGKMKEELNVKRTARLSLHIDKDKNITSQGLEAIIETIQYFRKIAKFYHVKTKDIQCVATAVLREASNKKQIVKEIKKTTKINVELLTGLEEAYYGYVGVVNSCDINNGVTIDIGGGSTEITLFENGILKYSHSFSFGAVTLTKDFIKGKKPTKKEMKRLSKYLSNKFSKLPWLKEVNYPVIGIGGTARNLSKIYGRSKFSSTFKLHQLKMRKEDIQLISSHLQSLSLRKRKRVDGLSKNRADIIIAGIEAIQQLISVVEAPSFMTSSQGLREGLCYSSHSYNNKQAK